MRQQPQKFDETAIQQLFRMQPDNQLTPAQIVRRDLFARWEVIRPADFNPVDAQTRRIQELLAEPEQPDQHLH